MVIHDDWMIWEIPPWLWKPPYWVVDGWSITRQGCNYCIGGWSWWIRDLPESPESMLRYASRFQKGPIFLDGEFPVSKLFVWSRVWLQWTCYFIFSWGSAVIRVLQIPVVYHNFLILNCEGSCPMFKKTYHIVGWNRSRIFPITSINIP